MKGWNQTQPPGLTYREVLSAGGHRSVVRALAAEVRNLGFALWQHSFYNIIHLLPYGVTFSII